MTNKLYNFQKDGVTFLKETPRALLADECGLGKTAQAIIAASTLYPVCNLNHLVICPASVKYNWQREINKWDPGATTFIIESRNPGKIPRTKYVIVNYDIVHSKKVFLQLISRRYGALILDECHYLKNNRAIRTKSIYYPKGMATRAQSVWGLTGTPVLNRPVELFSHLKALAPERLGKYSSYMRFTQRFCRAYTNRFGWDVSGASNLDELRGMLDGFMLRRAKTDVIEDLPDKTIQVLELSTTKKLEDLAQKEREGYERSQNNILGELASTRRESGVLKVPLVVEHVKNLLEEKEKIVLFAYHKDVIKQLASALTDYGPVVISGDTLSKMRLQTVDKFRTGKNHRVFIGQIEAAGTGVDGLQDACDTIVFAETDWVPGRINQAIDRCHRIGQKNPVLIQFLIIKNSIDEDLIDAVSRKEKVIDQIVKTTSTTKKESDKMVEVQLKIQTEYNSAVEAIAAIGKALKGVGDLYFIQGVDSLPMGNKLGTPVLVKTAPKTEAPKKTAPKTEVLKKEEAPVDFGGGEGEAPVEEIMTPPEFLKYCNEAIGGLEDPEKQAAIVIAVTAVFEKKFGLKSIAKLPAEKIVAAKIEFDKIVKV